ncbi:hypothetical protein ACGFJC_53020 [Nonomuraea fuscirosea]|uniref:hypothetical protein n=1 Tax=Nonomuraea fuscirosea TaxID=1291556 RepID=UPI00348C50A1
MSESDIDPHLRTQAFARVLGPYIAIFTTVLAIRLPDMTTLIGDLFSDAANVWILAAVMLAGGLVIIGGHRNWRGPAAVTVSLFGWFVALRGLGLIATTSVVQDTVNAVTLEPGPLAAARGFFGLLALMGLWLTYVGWFSRSRPRSGAARPSR